jgi:hypothetical protein
MTLERAQPLPAAGRNVTNTEEVPLELLSATDEAEGETDCMV